MAMTLRLSEELAARGRRYAAELGISLNGLLAVALREYLDQRKPEVRVPPRSEPQTLAEAIVRQVKAGPGRQRR
jgi:hypothetical protein